METPVAGQPTVEQLMARIRELESAQQSSRTANGITFKVGAKGGLSAYGLGRFPVTLYRSQWERLIASVEAGEVKAAIDANADILAVKPVKE